MKIVISNEINQYSVDLSLISPKPNWRCRDCQHELYLKEIKEAPLKCPKCGSQNIRTNHIRVIKQN